MDSPSRMNENTSPEKISVHDVAQVTADVFEPKWKHIQEDLKYMFLIDIDDEEDLKNPLIKNKMYDVMTKELENGSHYALDYFVEENLLEEKDIKEEDLPRLQSYAFKILDTLKGPRLVAAKNLFAKVGIISIQ